MVTSAAGFGGKSWTSLHVFDNFDKSLFRLFSFG